MLNDNDLIRYIRRVARTANDTHRCSPWTCGDSRLTEEQRTRYAGGVPPRGWEAKAARLAKENGWKMIRTSLLRTEAPPGTDGGTTGAFSPGRPELARTVMLADGLPPAKEYVVACHELAHVLLRHPYETEQEALDALMTKRLTGMPEDFHDETSAHLAATAAGKSAGLIIGQPCVCYLAKRVAGHGKFIGEPEVHAAFQAARVMRDALT